MSKASRPHLRVRFIRESEWPAVEELYGLAFATVRSVYRPTAEATRRQKARFREGDRLVAEVQGELVGTVQLCWQRDCVFISGLAVHPRWRQQGVATAILKTVTQLAAMRKCRELDLETIAQTGNVSIFEKLGFRSVGSEVPDWCESDQYDELVSVRMIRVVG